MQYCYHQKSPHSHAALSTLLSFEKGRCRQSPQSLNYNWYNFYRLLPSWEILISVLRGRCWWLTEKTFWWKMKLLEKFYNVVLKIIDWFLIEPKRLVRLVVLSVCSIVVFFQLWECAMKLLHPPVSTHSHFDLNKTMYYPAVTFCREPGFKVEVMEVNICWVSKRLLIQCFLRNSTCPIILASLQAGKTSRSKIIRFRTCMTQPLTPEISFSASTR